MSANELSPDAKGSASLGLAEVIKQTRNNFPDPRYRPVEYHSTPQYFLGGINASPHLIWPTADGIGTKPELAERLYTLTGNPKYFEGLAFDTFAMIESDEARWGRILLGIANIIDTNMAEPKMVSTLARGAKKACDEGQFALLNGETAELGYRVSGYGEHRLNWNAVGISIVNPNKLIYGATLKAGQPAVAFRERSIRSNGLTRARSILETAYLQELGCPSKEQFFLDLIGHELDRDGFDPGLIGEELEQLPKYLEQATGHPFLEQVLVPWHDYYTDLTDRLLTPSRLYGKVINTAQGWVDGEKEVEITAAAHISGGGVPEKTKRILESQRLGIHLDPIFPDPEAVTDLMELARKLPEQKREALIDDRRACEQWNRGIGFIAVTATEGDAYRLIEIAANQGYEAGIAGHIIEESKIEWRGYTWTY